MAKKLDEEKRKQIIADYILTESFRETGRMNGVADNTVRKIIKSNSQMVADLQTKKREQELSVEDYIVARQEKVKDIIDQYLELMVSDQVMSKATPNQLTTAIGTLMDKFMSLPKDKAEQAEESGIIMMPQVMELENPNE